MHSHNSCSNSWYIVTFEMLNPNCFEASIAFFDSWICNDFINDLTLTNKTRINLWLYHGHLQYLTQTLCYGTQQKLINSVWKPNQLDVRGWVRNRFVKCIFITSKNGFYHWQTLQWSRICWWSGRSPHVILTYLCVLTHSYVFRNCHILWLGFDPFQNNIAQHT